MLKFKKTLSVPCDLFQPDFVRTAVFIDGTAMSIAVVFEDVIELSVTRFSQVYPR